MKAVSLPDGVVYIKYATAAHLLTTAMCPKGAHDGVAGEYGDVYASVDRKLSRAVELGDLLARDPLTHRRHPYPVGKALREADILVEDLKHYVAGQGLPAIELASSGIDLP
jgi:hypothetical protein